MSGGARRPPPAPSPPPPRLASPSPLPTPRLGDPTHPTPFTHAPPHPVEEHIKLGPGATEVWLVGHERAARAAAPDVAALPAGDLAQAYAHWWGTRRAARAGWARAGGGAGGVRAAAACRAGRSHGARRPARARRRLERGVVAWRVAAADGGGPRSFALHWSPDAALRVSRARRAWPPAALPGCRPPLLYASGAASLQAHARPRPSPQRAASGVEGAALTLPLEAAAPALPPALAAKWPHLAGCTQLALAREHWDAVRAARRLTSGMEPATPKPSCPPPRPPHTHTTHRACGARCPSCCAARSRCR